eukprot:190672-Pelagomonas_calceolata.AAC.2
MRLRLSLYGKACLRKKQECLQPHCANDQAAGIIPRHSQVQADVRHKVYSDDRGSMEKKCATEGTLAQYLLTSSRRIPVLLGSHTFFSPSDFQASNLCSMLFLVTSSSTEPSVDSCKKECLGLEWEELE